MQTTHMATPVLEVAHLEKVYGALGNVTRALNDVSFTVNRGEFVGIMGASGSGKSTLLNCVSTIDSATSGTIRINGQDVTRMKQAKLSQFRREELGFIFQDSNLLDTLTARENIALPLTIARTNSAEISTRVQDVAARLSISQVLDKYPYQMSGGQQQRVAAARALVTDPTMIMPTSPPAPSIPRALACCLRAWRPSIAAYAPPCSWSRTTALPPATRAACCLFATARSSPSCAAATPTVASSSTALWRSLP